ncbi:MAG: hypothetical protein WA738_19630, partial [Candidatus Angelobacter sp.]
MTPARAIRVPRRQKAIAFEFMSTDAQPFQVKAEDASIRFARFPSSEQERIARADKSATVFFSPDVATVIKHIGMHLDPSRQGEAHFVITYKSCQYENGKQISGNRASYKIIDFIGAGQSAETYKAKVMAISSPADDLCVGDDVVIKIPVFDPLLGLEEQINLSSNLVTLFFREEASLLRLRSLDCVASFVDSGPHKFSRAEVPATRLMIQRFVDGNPLDEYLKAEHSESGA